METNQPPPSDRRLSREYSSLSRKIFHLAHRDLQRPEFFAGISDLILEYSRCEIVELYVREGSKIMRSKTNRPRDEYEHLELDLPEPSSRTARSDTPADPVDALCLDLLAGLIDRSNPCFTPRGTLLNDGATPWLELYGQEPWRGVRLRYDIGAEGPFAVLPIVLDEADLGLMVLRAAGAALFARGDIELYERIAQIVGITVIHHRTQLALRERVKELTCVYNISTLVSEAGTSLAEILQQAVDLLPPALLHSEVATAQILLDEQPYRAARFSERGDRLRAQLRVVGRQRGWIEVIYTRPRPQLDEGPFLHEERRLIGVVAEELSKAVEQRETEQERVRHADRLATIGQLAAGVAHELNEPLGNVLGFAQLAQRAPGVPAQVQEDLDKIVAAALHARETIKKLMLFARQSPPRAARLDLNQMIGDGLYFLEARCARAGIELVRELAPGIPELVADSGQVHQVLVNLTVNAIQAMPAGGRLVLRTRFDEQQVILAVHDTGAGIAPDVLGKIFMPFFTTKDVGEGTGLGLAVVEGIVTAHGGRIGVESPPGGGCTFTVWLPRRPPSAAAPARGGEAPDKGAR